MTAAKDVHDTLKAIASMVQWGRDETLEIYTDLLKDILDHIDTLTRERDEAVDRGLELQAQLMTMLVQRDEALVVDDADKLERAGRAIYEGLHASNGVFWHAVKEKHVWRGLAFNALTAALSEATP
jgi:hypothetical protein